MAQEKLYKHYYGFAMSIALRYCSSRENAKEVLNDSFLKVFLNIDNYNPDKNFEAWLKRIIVNTAIDRYRKEYKYNNEIPKENIYADSFEENIINNINAEDIIKIIQKLPESYRIVFNLYELEGYTHDEIAKELDINESTSRSILSRAKKKLRHLISNLYGIYN